MHKHPRREPAAAPGFGSHGERGHPVCRLGFSFKANSAVYFMSDLSADSEGSSSFVGPITSLLLIPKPWKQDGRLLLLGSGCFISAFYLPVSSHPIATRDPKYTLYQKVLTHDRIHHIKPLEHPLKSTPSSLNSASCLAFVCAGGREFVICFIERKSVQEGNTRYCEPQSSTTFKSISHLVFKKIKVVTINDWIIDINFHNQFSPEHTRIALLTSHDRLLLYELEAQKQLRETRTIVCQDTTLLLSGQIRIQFCEHDQCTKFCIAAGSISGNVALWEWIDNDQNPSIQQVHTILSGHKGAIYDLAYSPLGQKICTASEDRTVRVWDLENLSDSPIVLWGHLGRVWRVHWWNSEQLTSVGEDCRVLTWKLAAPKSRDAPESGNKPRSESSLKPFSVIHPEHDGRSIWSVTHDQETGYLLTGGADGKICLTQIDTPEITVKKITSADQIPIKAFNVSWDGSLVLYICQNGSVYTRVLSDPRCREKLVFQHASIFGCQCYVEFVPSSTRTAYLATNQGYIVSIDQIDEPNEEIRVHNLKNTITMFAVCKTGDKVSCLIYDCKQNACLLYDISGNRDPQLICRMSLKSMNAPTCMKLSEESRNPPRLLVFVGDAKGCAAVGEVTEKTEVEMGPLVSLHQDGILDIELDQDHPSICFRDYLRLRTLGRDGNWTQSFIQIAHNSHIEILQIHQNPLIRGSLHVFLNSSPRSRYIGGFEKAWWKLFDLQTGTMVGSCKVACNGQPNIWVCRNRANQSFLFYQQQGSILIESLSLPNRNDPIHLISNFGTHGREINCSKVAYLPGMLEIVATGSENGVLEISIHQRQSTSQPLVRVYRNARIPFAIKCLGWLRNSPECGATKQPSVVHPFHRETLFLIISGSREIFQTFRITLDRENGRINDPHAIDVGVSEWSCFSHRSGGESEVRIMDLDPLYLASSTWLLSTAHSDGNIRIWTFDIYTNQQRLILEHRTTHCVFCIQILPIGTVDQREILVLAGLSDGTANIFILPKIRIPETDDDRMTLECQTMAVQWRLTGHQSGVMCVQGRAQQNRVTVVTGGDDNAIVVSFLEVFGDHVTGFLVQEKRKITQVDAHSSSINVKEGLRFTEEEQEQEDPMEGILFSVSTDQKLKMWSINPHLTRSTTKPPLTMNLLKIVHTDVVGCTSINLLSLHTHSPTTVPLEENRPDGVILLLAGIGMENNVIRFPL
ncbi:hypothetical protein PCANC_27203 [Puccinia coronata f. sp. avenae]|uniref:Uncharacterized protein n=1 Tax=Puccinia coronata f. sp. avenae TaxID=200324 RepID=A0A2N5RZB0_9BASI|nr:hypothetical protein PCANC_27203 [Puccinia coronata f. sp. avenae]